jgi:hypothetical protein
VHAIWKSRNSNGKAKVTAVNISVLLLVQRLPSTSENKTVACGDLFPLPEQKTLCFLEQQRRCRWRGADVKARHGAEELDIGDPLDGRIGSSKRIDQADCDVVTVDIVALDRRLPVRAR